MVVDAVLGDALVGDFLAPPSMPRNGYAETPVASVKKAAHVSTSVYATLDVIDLRYGMDGSVSWEFWCLRSKTSHAFGAFWDSSFLLES